MTVTMTTFADAEDVLAASLPNYESRTQQQAFAAAIEDALDHNHHLLAEAGCGTGKSLGYLIPAILSGKRVVISTATKALQDQIVQKDLPFLREHLGIDFTFAVLKGRSNYLCRAKLNDSEVQERIPNAADIIRIADEGNAAWDQDSGIVGDGHLGERDDFGDFIGSDMDWRMVTTSSEECPGRKECPFSHECFAEIAKAKAMAAQIVVVNHALYFTDMMVREKTGGQVSMLGPHELVIFDEAHEVEEYATNMLGTKYTVGTFTSMAAQVRNFGHRVNDNSLSSLAEDVDRSARYLFDALPTHPKDKAKAHRLFGQDFVDIGDELVTLIDALRDLAKGLRWHFNNSENNGMQARAATLLRRASSAQYRLQEMVTDDWENVVRWVEVEKDRRGEDRKMLCATMIHLGDYLAEHLWGFVQGVLVSATLSTDGTFDYIAGRLGFEDFKSIDVGTPFDYSQQALLYVPRDLAQPAAATRAQWEEDVVPEIERLVLAADGRALLLFTSRYMMNKVHREIAHKLPYTVMKQGDAPNNRLVEQFKTDTHSVLFALKSFFTGVDVQGDALSLVVIDKLPFPTPDEPVIQARVDQIEEHGGNGFKDFTVPFMALTLKQGFGRLVRHRNDAGVVAILDSRLVKKPYGKRILKSLPPASFCDEGSDVTEFFEEVAASA